jgi:hypothetical protein
VRRDYDIVHDLRILLHSYAERLRVVIEAEDFRQLFRLDVQKAFLIVLLNRCNCAGYAARYGIAPEWELALAACSHLCHQVVQGRPCRPGVAEQYDCKRCSF